MLSSVAMSLLEALTDELQGVIMGFLTGRQIASASLGARSWQRLSASSRFWHALCVAEFGVERPQI